MNKQTDYEIELGRIDREISELGAGSLRAPVDTERATRYVYRLYQRASLTGDFAQLEVAGAAIDELAGQFRHPSDLLFLKANLNFKFHRLAEVRRDLEASAVLSESPQGRAIWADLDFQEGRYDAARSGYDALVRDERTWDGLARRAHLEFKLGDAERAEQLYAESVDELTAKEMRHYAWVELQRGVLDVSRGRYEEAREHYERAGRAYSGHWLADEHMAELLGAQGRFADAVALYREVNARVPRPEFRQALGELYEFMGEPAQAQPWYEDALNLYLDSARRGEVHYYHHLVDFYSDVREDGAEAVRWARKDLELRDNFSTQAALAWAFYRDDQLAEAHTLMGHALSSGVRDARLFNQAAIISEAAGADDEANNYLRLAAEINPHLANFHVHR